MQFLIWLFKVSANNFFELSIISVKTNLTETLEETFNDMIILKSNIRAIASIAEKSIINETQKQIEKSSLKCRQTLENFKTRFGHNCVMENNFKILETTRLKFEELYKVACLTEEICKKLNPLSNQNFEKCILDKIIDLNFQTSHIIEEFENRKKQLFEDSDHCVRFLLNDAFKNLSNIVTYCNFSWDTITPPTAP